MMVVETAAVDVLGPHTVERGFTFSGASILFWIKGFRLERPHGM